MPLINGMKMACEPCIRGHRSTKCNHANERLMVPVRKPGRPLSSCPHLKDHLCSCNSITAAIPRKQVCQCSISSSTKNTNVATRATPSSSVESPISPGKPSFRIDKNYQKSHSKRKSSGVATLERINSCQIQNHQELTNRQQIPIASSNGYYVSPFLNTIGHYSQTSPSLVPQSLRMNGVSQVSESSQYCNGDLDNGHSYTMNHNPIIGPYFFPNGASSKTEKSPISDQNFTEIMDGVIRSPGKKKSCCEDRENGYGNQKDPTVKLSTIKKAKNGTGNNCPIQETCCMLKCTNQSNTSSTGSFTEQKESKITNSCCLETPKTLNQNIVSRVGAQSPFPETVDFNHQFYSYPPPQQPVFSYETALYGSFLNPLNVSTWRQTHDNMFSHSQGQSQVTDTFPTAPVPEVRSFVKSCNCGDACQCVGCVSHPYNDATQDYVRSAWQTISVGGTSSESYTNGQAPHEDQSTVSQENVEKKSGSNPTTPSSSNAEEQSLPENNFLFVNYSFPSEGCEGGDFSYECNNNCQCIGCDIKRRNPG